MLERKRDFVSDVKRFVSSEFALEASKVGVMLNTSKDKSDS